jgi:hypothetical protein
LTMYNKALKEDVHSKNQDLEKLREASLLRIDMVFNVL